MFILIYFLFNVNLLSVDDNLNLFYNTWLFVLSKNNCYDCYEIIIVIINYSSYFRILN